jgi:hypothetical protein
MIDNKWMKKSIRKGFIKMHVVQTYDKEMVYIIVTKENVSDGKIRRD